VLKPPLPAAAALLLVAITALLTIACGSGDASGDGWVTVEPLPSRTAAIPTSVKAAAPSPTPPPAGEPTPPPEQPSATPEAASTPAPPGPTSTPAPAGPPTTGRWIDVDVTNYMVRLMDGASVLQQIGPVGVGVQIDTGEYLSTQTGLFAVHTKYEALAYDAPFDTYISHWIGFDAAKDNGFHSLLKDANGAVVDASTGRVSNGCIRVGDIEAVFAFAEIGMPVYVHF
jgi:hypothetical protein